MSRSKHLSEMLARETVPSFKAEGAFLGAAIGDALGWPQERPRARIDKTRGGASESKSMAIQTSFQTWGRQAGGRFAPHVEIIKAGEYSDDTQLILATARSLTKTSDWYNHFCWMELPVWVIYERGGGSSTLAAIQGWRKGIPPWRFIGVEEQSRNSAARYFASGGNGVAMRILPHALLRGQTSQLLCDQIAMNGAATHGHPRALLGAQLYGYAMWLVARLKGPLKYGELIDCLLDTVGDWSALPNWNVNDSEWLSAANRHTSEGYERSWSNVIEEARRGLELCRQSLSQGALSIGRKVMNDLGCFDPRVGGAGTVSALAAVYLASRHAADPVTGLLEVAYATGADTDTLASMVGALMGGLLGTEWLLPEWNIVQDRSYIKNLSHIVAEIETVEQSTLEPCEIRWSEAASAQAMQALEMGSKEVSLGALGQCRTLKANKLETLTNSIDAYMWQLQTEFEQTVYVKKITRQAKEREVTRNTKIEVIAKPESPIQTRRATSNSSMPLSDRTDDPVGRVIDVYPERANLYPLTLSPRVTQLYKLSHPVDGQTHEDMYFEAVSGSAPVDASVRNVRQALLRCVLDKIKGSDYKVRRKFSLFRAAVVDAERNYAPRGTSLQIYPSFKLHIAYINGHFYLCLDHQLLVRAVLSLAALLRKDQTFRPDESQHVFLKEADSSSWAEGHIENIEDDTCHIKLNSGQTTIALAKDVYPELTRIQINHLAPALGTRAEDLERLIKQYSFLTARKAPRARLSACTEFAGELAHNVFPIVEGKTALYLEPIPAVLRPPSFEVGTGLEEPFVSFDHVDSSKRGRDILKGLTTFGAYDKPSAPIRLILLALRDTKLPLERLVERLNRGHGIYLGAQKTFQSEMVVGDVLVCANVNEYEDRIRDFVRSTGRKDTDVALVYLPKEGNTSDWQHPYFRTKALLLKEGLVSQMVDRRTVLSPDYRDLNLALNIYAKAGYAPWVLDEAITGVDLFIGLSSSQVRRGGNIIRMMSYVNVFDSYGRWKFYQGDTLAFDFTDRLRHYEALVKDSVAAYRRENQSGIKTVHIHLTKFFSKIERAVLASAVRAAAPGATVVFVSVNPDHTLRLYDLSEGGDGSIRRSTYLRDDNRLYLATTGSNIFKQPNMGTPIPLELTVWADPQMSLPSSQEVGQQILSLTRLNWASSRSFCHEPITTKFAGEIAYLMTAFMNDPSFTVNPSLRGQPWFL